MFPVRFFIWVFISRLTSQPRLFMCDCLFPDVRSGIVRALCQMDWIQSDLKGIGYQNVADHLVSYIDYIAFYCVTFTSRKLFMPAMTSAISSSISIHHG